MLAPASAEITAATSPASTISGLAACSARAARPSATRSENTAKQVAPEPDMRANRTPSSAASRSSTSAMTGATPIAAA